MVPCERVRCVSCGAASGAPRVGGDGFLRQACPPAVVASLVPRAAAPIQALLQLVLVDGAPRARADELAAARFQADERHQPFTAFFPVNASHLIRATSMNRGSW